MSRTCLRPVRNVFFAALLLAWTPACFADGILRTLPKSGEWVEYHATLKFDTTESNGTARLRSLGAESFGDEPCRWIELEMNDGERATQLYKLLVPVKHLGDGSDPVDHAVRIWFREGDGAVQQVEPKKMDLSFAGAMLHQPVKADETLEKRKFPWQRGTIEATGRKGTRSLEKPLGGTLTSSRWLTDDVPSGVAGLLVVIRPQGSNSEFRLELVVNDFGTDAKSALPDHN